MYNLIMNNQIIASGTIEKLQAKQIQNQIENISQIVKAKKSNIKTCLITTNFKIRVASVVISAILTSLILISGGI